MKKPKTNALLLVFLLAGMAVVPLACAANTYTPDMNFSGSTIALPPLKFDYS